jgi:predicted  nucleic acid-binding Zn-ribbon protein
MTKEKENRTIVDICEERLAKIRAERDAENARARDKIKKFMEEKEAIRKEYYKLKEQAESLAADYLKLQETLRAEEENEIKKEAITEEDLRSGLITMAEFMKVGKRLAEIKAEAREAAEKKLADARAIVRGLNLKRYELADQMAKLDEKIQREYSFAAARFHFEVGAIRRTLEEHGVTSAGVEVMHSLSKVAANDLAMASRGVALWSVKQWTVRDIAEAEKIVLDPIMQERHIKDFRKIIEEIRGREWVEATIFYTPSDIVGRPAGDIWFSLRYPRKRGASKVSAEIEVKA